MQETSPVGNETATNGDSRAVDTTASTPTTPPEPTTDPRPDVPGADLGSQHFPPTLVGLDPPTLPAAEGMRPAHRDPDSAADLPQFRPFPHPQRSEPGHPGLRRLWKRMITFWRRTTI